MDVMVFWIRGMGADSSLRMLFYFFRHLKIEKRKDQIVVLVFPKV